MKSITKTVVSAILVLVPIFAIAADVDKNIFENSDDAFVNINSKPPGAEIFIDNTYIGTTPLIMVPLKPGSYMLLGKVGNYKDVGINIKLTESSNNDVTLEFTGRKDSSFSFRDYLLGLSLWLIPLVMIVT